MTTQQRAEKVDAVIESLFGGLPPELRAAPIPPIPNPLVCEECDNELNDCICGRADCRSCGEEAPVVELNANGGLCDGCMPDPDLERDCEESEQ
jgi:hypothetical protein